MNYEKYEKSDTIYRNLYLSKKLIIIGDIKNVLEIEKTNVTINKLLKN